MLAMGEEMKLPKPTKEEEIGLQFTLRMIEILRLT